MQHFEFCPLAQKDHQDFLTLLKQLPGFFSPATISYAEQRLPECDGFMCLAQDPDGNPTKVGFISFHISSENPQQANLNWLAVHPNLQGQGIGSKLLKHMERKLQEKQVDTIELSTIGYHPDYPEFEQTRKFYRGHGYNEVRKYVDQEDSSVEILVLQKRLSSFDGVNV